MSIPELERYAPAFRNGDAEGQYNGFKQLLGHVEMIYAVIGHEPIRFVDRPGLAATNIKLPPAAQFSVVGIDGKFIVTIVNPESFIPVSPQILQQQIALGMNVNRGRIFHQLQSAPDVNFNLSSPVIDYGVSTQLTYTYQDPNVTKFWRLRSSFDGRNWNNWQIYESAITCGPVGVQSGLLRTAALSQANAAATPTTQPLTATTGGSANHATITIASFQVQYPKSVSPSTNGLVSYNLGAITPLNDSTLYYVYCKDPTYAGGAQTYIASTSNPDVTSDDPIVFLGIITTPAFGGGGTGGHGGGGGACFTGNTRVITKRGFRRITEIVDGVDEVLTQRGWRKVRHVLEHAYAGPMHDMGDEEFVTPDHRIWWHERWEPAIQIWHDVPACHVTGRVYNLDIEGDGSDEEQCYVLGNGWIAHNTMKI